jgi:alkylhydroperoxidase family enzyme
VPSAATFAPDRPTDEVIAEVLGGQPQVAANLSAAHAAAWAAVDPVLLELCRLRIAQLLGNDAELVVRNPAATASGLDEATIAELASWPASPRFGARERACLAFCEQSLIDVANVTSDQTQAISAELGVQGLADFVSALLVIEQRQRLRLVWEQLFSTAEGHAHGA